MFVVVLSVRDAVTYTLELLPVAKTNAWWRWLIALVHILIAILALKFTIWYGWLDESGAPTLF